MDKNGGIKRFYKSLITGILLLILTPAHLQAAYTLHFGNDLEIRGDYAYVAITGTSNSATDVIYMTPPPAELPSGLRVIDISDPDSPEIVGGLDYSNSGTLCIEVDGDLAYLAYSGSEGVKIIDISDPEKPKIIGTIKNVHAREMVVRNGYAYLADPDLGLVIFDVSDPTAPSKAATLNLNGMVEDIAVQGNFAYLTFNDNDYPKECGIQVCDISEPEDPSLVDRFVAGTGLDSDVPAGGRMMIWMNADYAYLAKESVIIIVDVSDPENLSREEIWHLPGMPPYSHVPSTEKLAGSGDYIYVTGDVNNENEEELLFVVNISDPLNPDLAGYVPIYRPHDIAAQGDYACIVGTEGFQIIDISDPDDPSVVGKIEGTHQSRTYPIIDGIYGYRYGSPYLMGPYQSYPGFRYGYPSGGFGTSGGYGFGYPYGGFGTSGGYGFGYPNGGFGTSGGYGFGYPYGGFGTYGSYGYPYNPYGYQRTNFASGLGINPYGGIGGGGFPGYGFGYPYGSFGTSGGYGYGYPLGGYGTFGGYGYPTGWRPF